MDDSKLSDFGSCSLDNSTIGSFSSESMRKIGLAMFKGDHPGLSVSSSMSEHSESTVRSDVTSASVEHNTEHGTEYDAAPRFLDSCRIKWNWSLGLPLIIIFVAVCAFFMVQRGQVKDMDGIPNCSLNVDGSSLQSLETGWHLKLNGDAPLCNFTTFESDAPTLRVVVMGGYKQGKTTLIHTLHHGFQRLRLISENIETIGLRIFKSGNILYFDEGGSGRAVSQEKVTDRVVTDSVIQELGLHMANIVLYHVGDIETSDVLKIQNLNKRAHELNQRIKAFVVVHMLKEYSLIATIKDRVKNIVESFNVKEIQNGKCTILSSTNPFNQHVIEHVVFAKEGSEAGEAYNLCALNRLKTKIESFVSEEQKYLLVDSLVHNLQQILPTVFFDPSADISEIPVALSPLQHGFEAPQSRSTASWLDHVGAVTTSYVKNIANIFRLHGTVNEESANGTGQLEACNCLANISGFELETLFDPSGYVVRLKDRHAKLSYFPVSDEDGDGVPKVSFEPNYDVLLSPDNTKLTIAVDVVNSIYKVFYSEIDVNIIGCRKLSEEAVGMRRINSAHKRKFSSFNLKFACPRQFGMNCRIAQSELKQDGVLTITFTNASSPMVYFN